MKKLFFSLIIAIMAFTLNAQMIRTEHKQIDVHGVKVNAITYTLPVDNGSWLVFFHGAGEVGPVDGSQLAKIEKHGPLKHAKAGHVYGYNILGIQAQSYFTSLDKYLLEWMRVKLGAKKILITGLSRGGQEVHNLTMADLSYKDLLIVAAVPIAGRPDAYSTANPATVKDVPMVVVHGQLDNTVPYSQDTTWCGRVNRVPGRKNKIKFITLKGVAHEGWTWAYSIDPENEVMQFINKMLEPDPVVNADTYLEEFKLKAIEAINTIK
jgi:predicted peptidase